MYNGKLVRLRELRIDDAETCLGWVNDLSVARKIYGGAPMPATIENERDFLRAVTGKKHDQNHFAIENPAGEFIGVCSYTGVDWTNRTCSIGWFIGEDAHRGRGYGTDMIKLMLDICFLEMDMHRVELNVFEYNTDAIRLYERLGFVREGAERRSVYSMGRRWDEIKMSMLRREYDALYGGDADV